MQTMLMPNRQHFAIFAPSLMGGGAERVMVMVANGLARRGHRIDLILVRAAGPYLTEVSDSVNLIDLKCSRAATSFVPLVRYLRQQRPDAILSILGHLNLIATLAGLTSHVGTRVVISERNSLTKLETGWRSRVKEYLQRLLYPRASKIISVSQGIAGQLAQKLHLSRERIIAIPNPVDVESVLELSRAPVPHTWLASQSVPVILAVGRLEAQKDYPTLLAAFAKLRRERTVRLIILGEGSLRQQLEHTVADAGLSDCVLFAGFQVNPFCWMSAASLYVLSSRYEGFPNSLLQAMACGAKVVSTDCPTGPGEILEGGKWGTLVQVGNVDALAKALAASLDAPGTSLDIRKRLLEFHPEAIITRYERALQ